MTVIEQSLVAAEEVGLSAPSGVARFPTQDKATITLAAPGTLYTYINLDLWNPVDQFQVRLLIDNVIRMSWLAGPSPIPETYKLVDLGGGSLTIAKVPQESGSRAVGPAHQWSVAAGTHTVEYVYVSFSGAATANAARGKNRRLVTSDAPVLALPGAEAPVRRVRMLV